MTEKHELAGIAAELRERFDQSFAEPAHAPDQHHEDVIAVRVAGQPFALRTRELSTVMKDRVVIPFPTADAALVGMAGIRAAVVPVYSLAVLLGYPAAMGRERTWLAVVANPALAFAFDEFAGFERLSRGNVIEQHHAEQAPAFVRQAARINDVLHGIIDVHLLVERITASKEQ